MKEYFVTVRMRWTRHYSTSVKAESGRAACNRAKELARGYLKDHPGIRLTDESKFKVIRCVEEEDRWPE